MSPSASDLPAARLVCALGLAALAACGGGGGDGVSFPVGGGRPSESSATPVATHAQLAFTQLGSSFSYDCGIATDGRAWCWGMDEYGQLGSTATMSTCIDATARCSAQPLLVETDQRFASVAPTYGVGRTCALTPAGEAWCWGNGIGGGLGDGSTTSRATPAPVAGNLQFAFLKTSQDGSFACAMGKDATIYCWGGAAHGMAGTGQAVASYLVPTPMAWGRRFVAFDLGEFHVCALTQEGEAYCWGSNWYGQVGIGDPGGQGGSLDILVPTAVAGGHKFRAVATGSDTTCALAQDGATWCWGIDTGTTPASHPEPTLVPGAPAFSSIHAGFRHMCGLTRAGEAWCWGYGNPSGSSTTPVRVATSVPFASLADRPYCGLDTAGKAWCWGNNDYHQLGY